MKRCMQSNLFIVGSRCLVKIYVHLLINIENIEQSPWIVQALSQNMVILKVDPIMSFATFGQGNICDEHSKFYLREPFSPQRTLYYGCYTILCFGFFSIIFHLHRPPTSIHHLDWIMFLLHHILIISPTSISCLQVLLQTELGHHFLTRSN
jgi:hypothetical protein